jgi:hypothetical protein
VEETFLRRKRFEREGEGDAVPRRLSNLTSARNALSAAAEIIDRKITPRNLN